MLKRFLLVMLLGMVSIAWAAPAVHEFKLDNGLKVLVQEDHRAPVVVSQIWYKVGSSYEPTGMTGISHVLEHMMFKGTKNLQPGEFSRIIAAQGGNQNAFTSRDYTAYFQTLPKEHLEVSFRLEADRMANLQLTEELFTKEIQVVIEERRLRTEDAPQSLTYEQFNAVAYVTSPYRNPVIGWMKDLKDMRLEDVRSWYRQWYSPNNAILVVVGDVDPQQVLELAKTHFGSLQPSDVSAPGLTHEVPQRGERRAIVKEPAELPYIILGYKAPVLKTTAEEWEPYALQVLAGILDAGDSARLSRNLIRGSEIAAQAGASYNMHARLDELFTVAANPAPGHNLDELEHALRAELKQLREELIGDEELDRVVAQVIAADVYQRDSMFYQGMRLGVLETVGLGWEKIEDYVDRIKAVTPEQVREVARKYLVDQQLTVTILEPQPLGEATRPAVPGDTTDHIIR